MRIQAFQAIRPPVNQAARVASVPYDVVDSDQARQLAQGNPDSFLHVVRPEIDLPAGTSPYDEAVYAKARENFDGLLARGCLRRDERPSMFLYRLTMGEHRQTGLVSTCHVEDYERDVIKKHERTLPQKEDDRTRHVATLDANAGPVFLTYPDSAAVDSRVEEIQAQPALYDFVASDGVRHQAWQMDDPGPLVEAFAAIPAAYVADGHHRTASAARVGRERREANPGHTGTEAYNWFLCVLFPASQLQVLAYNRLVRDLHGHTPGQLLETLGSILDVRPDAPPAPMESGQVSMYLDGRWYGLSWPADAAADPVSALDVSVLQERVLGPVLGIDDPRTNPRIAFMGGIHGGKGLQTEVDAGAFAAGFSLHPTSIRQLMDIADAGQIMPPKSTWFEPKLRSGLFVNPLD